MDLKDLSSLRPSSSTALLQVIADQSKALKAMAKVNEALLHQVGSLKNIIIKNQDRIKELEIDLEAEQEENLELNYTIETLQKEKEDLEKNVTRN